MSTQSETVININDLGIDVHELTDEQVHHVYDELSEVDKASTDNLAAAEEETESSDYTSEDNNVIEACEEIPGVDVIPSNIAETIEEDENDIKDVLSNYDLDEESIVKMLTVIDEYKAGNKSSLYFRLPPKMQEMVNGILLTETGGRIDRKQINAARNNIARMLIDEFINDAKITAAVDDFNQELSSAVVQMNKEYEEMLGSAIDNTFNKIEEIRAEDPVQAERIESVKAAFDDASSFKRQLEFAKRISPKKLNKMLTRYADDVYYFNKKVNSNTIGVKVPNIEEIVPVIKIALPQYTEEDIKKFVICICRTIQDIDEISGISYEYRMISSIYKYKFTPIDEKGEVIFGNISKVIDAILS